MEAEKSQIPVETGEATVWQRPDLEQQLNSTFRCGDAELELTEVANMGSQTDAATGRPFSCLFEGQLEAGQGMFQLEHETLGSATLFLVPLGPQNGRMVFEAVFT